MHFTNKQNNMKTTNWYLQSKKRFFSLLYKIETEQVYRCTFNENWAIKFTTKKDALKYSKEHKIEKMFKPIEL